MTRYFARAFFTGTLVLLLAALAVPAFAQSGALRGKVIGENGRPVDQAEIVLDFVGDMKRQVKTITDKNGEWIRVGLPVGGGTWTVTAQKGALLGKVENLTIKLGETQKVADIVLQTPEALASGRKVVGAEEGAAIAKKAAETEALLNEANAAITAGNHDEAIAKLNALIAKLEEKGDKCSTCFDKIGEIEARRGHPKEAEAAFLKAIELDANLPGPYSSLASLYNELGRLEEATKMAEAAMKLTGGDADPAMIFNQGVIYWNQSKIPEAKAQWTKAIELDPKMTDAYYWLGMASVNQGQLPEAKAAFEMYLKLAPKGQYAETATAILKQIK